MAKKVWITPQDGWVYAQEQEASPSPIRTRREIVPGVYGPIEIGGMKEGRIFIRVGGDAYKADDIREIIHIASQVLEVLEKDAG